MLVWDFPKKKKKKIKQVWKATQLAKTVNAEVTLDLQFPIQRNKQGIGFGKFKLNPQFSK